MDKKHLKAIMAALWTVVFFAGTAAGLALSSTMAASDTSPTTESSISGGSVTINETINTQNPAVLAAMAKIFADQMSATSAAKAQAETKAAELATKLGFTSAVVSEFFKILGEQDVPEDKVPARLVEIATHFAQIRHQLSALEPNDPHSAELVRSAKEALDSGQLTKAVALLDDAKESELAASRQALDLNERADKVEQSEVSAQAKILEQKAREAADRHFLSAAQSDAMRGNIALLQFHYADAAKHFKEATALVPAGQSDKKKEYLGLQADALYREGDARGDNAALRNSVEIHKNALRELRRDLSPLDWATAQNNLGISLEALGDREGSTALLKEAVAAFKAALEERTRERVPLYWAETQNNLAIALEALGEREGSTVLLEEAIAAYKGALEERTRERVPIDWARTQSNLGRAVERLAELEGGGTIWYKSKKWLKNLSGPQIAAALAATIVFGWIVVLSFLYWYNPARLVKWHEAFSESPTLEESAKVFDKVTFGAAAIIRWIAKCSILFLGTSRRAMEAWIEHRAADARAIFSARSLVRDRHIALDLPIRIDTVKYIEPWSELERLMSKNSPLAILISGPGGAGKTTLACQIGRRALAGMAEKPLGGRLMLPLLVEADVTDLAAKPDGLYSYLAGLLRAAVNEGRPISVVFAKALLRSGHVLVIVDGFSERSSTTRQAFDPQNPAFEIKRLIVTSRDRELPGMNTTIETETIPTGALFDFIKRYLEEVEESGEGKLPTEDRILDACGELKRLLGVTPCTPLLAAMWAREIGEPSLEGSPRPHGVASLMESYIRRILRPAANGSEALVDRLTKDAAKIAERELGERYQPGYVTRAAALEVLRTLDPSDIERRLGLLERSRLLDTPSEHSDAVRIAPDPIAEHLVARLRAEELRGDLKSWRGLLVQIRKQGLPSGFVAALVACAEDEIYGGGIPRAIRHSIEQLYTDGTEPQVAA